MEEKGKGVKVFVTGASGYIASWVVKFLLDRVYTVNATVRNPDDETKTGHLVALPGAKERLNLFKADLVEDGCFDSAVSGCVGVFHVASPVTLGFNADILDPAIKGTLNVLASCKKFPSVRRVVLTSSFAAVIYAYPAQYRTPQVVLDETWFSDPEICKKESKMMWYSLSKILAEEAAWKFAEENDIDMVSINPAMVIGPMLQSTLNDSVAAIINLINSSKTYLNATFGWVNIKDVANAHILAFENPSANGRYCLVETVAHHSETVKLLKELYPELPLPDKCQDDNPFMPTYQVSKEKAKSLGIEFIPFKVSPMETVQDLKEKGFVSFEQ